MKRTVTPSPTLYTGNRSERVNREVHARKQRSPSKGCCRQARSDAGGKLFREAAREGAPCRKTLGAPAGKRFSRISKVLQAAEQVLPTAMTRYMVVVLARLGALGHP